MSNGIDIFKLICLNQAEIINLKRYMKTINICQIGIAAGTLILFHECFRRIDALEEADNIKFDSERKE